MKKIKLPGKNCGLCGFKTCDELITHIENNTKTIQDCPFMVKGKIPKGADEVQYSENDILGVPYDFILDPVPGEISARKIVLPFRGDLVEKWNIKKGDVVLGRPMGQGCPVQHVLKVIEANPITGVITSWVVGPQYTRNNMNEVKDVQAYHVIAFEGIAKPVRKEPEMGRRQAFLPGHCMMNLAHTAVVNMILKKTEGLFVHLEDIRIIN